MVTVIEKTVSLPSVEQLFIECDLPAAPQAPTPSKPRQPKTDPVPERRDPPMTPFEPPDPASEPARPCKTDPKKEYEVCQK